MNSIVKSGTITKKIVEEVVKQNNKPYSSGIGIDLGIKEFATISDNRVFKNINKRHKIKKLKKSLKRQQRKLSRKYESLKI